MSNNSNDPNYGTWTGVDFMNAVAYATQQIAKEKCQDPEIIQRVCEHNGGGGGQCLAWEEDESSRIFPKPVNFYQQKCATNNDCNMGFCAPDGYCRCNAKGDCKQSMDCIPDPVNESQSICGWNPEVYSGHCKFVTEQACIAQRQLPYQCNCGPLGNSDGECTMLPEEKLKNPYVEWHIDPDTGKGKCVMGNFIYKQWCENPCVRCTKNKTTGEYPAGCTSGEGSPGIVDVPPFSYDESTGQCHITFDYCDHYGLEYAKPHCRTDSDCMAGDYCDLRANNPHCVGPGSKCHIPKGQKYAQMVVGRTIFYMFRNGFKNCIHKNPVKESYEAPSTIDEIDMDALNKEISDKFKNTPEIAVFVYNEKKVKNMTILAENFAGKGIHLYAFEIDDKMITAFLPREVEKKYPDVVIHQQGLDIINIPRSMLVENKDDKNIKRIYLTINSRGWMSNMFGNMLSEIKKKRDNK